MPRRSENQVISIISKIISEQGNYLVIHPNGKLWETAPEQLNTAVQKPQEIHKFNHVWEVKFKESIIAPKRY